MKYFTLKLLGNFILKYQAFTSVYPNMIHLTHWVCYYGMEDCSDVSDKLHCSTTIVRSCLICDGIKLLILGHFYLH